MLTVLASLAAPNISHVIFALMGALFAWYVKQYPNAIPPEAQAIVNLILARLEAQKQANAHATLQTLSQPVAGVVHSVEAAVLAAMSPPTTLAPAGSPGVVIAK